MRDQVDHDNMGDDSYFLLIPPTSPSHPPPLLSPGQLHSRGRAMCKSLLKKYHE
jgi:hypothetical protein